MTDATTLEQPAPLNPRATGSYMTFGRWSLLVIVSLFILFVAVWIYALAFNRNNNYVVGGPILDLEASNQKLTVENSALQKQIANLQERLKTAQAALAVIVPSKNTYRIGTNESINAAEGRLTIGVVGTPANASVTLNINGQQRIMAAGDVVDISPDQSTACKVRVVSFDILGGPAGTLGGAVNVNATCGPAKS